MVIHDPAKLAAETEHVEQGFGVPGLAANWEGTVWPQSPITRN